MNSQFQQANGINRRTKLISGYIYALWNGTEDDWRQSVVAEWNGVDFVDQNEPQKKYSRAEFEFCAMQGRA